MPTIQERVTKIVAEQLGYTVDCVTPEKNFRRDLLADELDEVEIVMSIEDEFGVEIPDEEGFEITTVAKAVEWLTKHGVAA